MRLLLLPILSAFLFSQDEELDLDAMWENTVWEAVSYTHLTLPTIYSV